MDDVARLSVIDRTDLFSASARRRGLTAAIIEKDFWVCWTLKRLFCLDGIGDTLLFKGGTSLSKVHRLIRRFSEDIDVSIHREFLGFSGAGDPLHADLSNKQRDKLKNELSLAARSFIAEKIEPALRASIEATLPVDPTRPWSLVLDESDADDQSLAFIYPTTSLTPSAASYLRPAVKIEFGARSDHWPAETKPVKPYLVDAIPGSMEEPIVKVKTMEATRTFWEKATILHQHAHLPKGKPFPARYSRHYTDLAVMIHAGVGNQAADREELLEAVVRHKIAFYRQAWARYEDAKRGTLRLLPSERNMADLKNDLASMREMFFDEPPSFESVIDTLTEFENTFNSIEQPIS